MCDEGLEAVIVQGNEGALKRYLDGGGDPNVIMYDGSSLMTNIIQQAPRDRVTPMLKIALDHGGNPNESNSAMTPLIEAAFSGRTEDVRLLLEQGADPNLRDHIGRYAILVAPSLDNLKIAKMLITAGCNLDVEDYEGGSIINSYNEADLTRLQDWARQR